MKTILVPIDFSEGTLTTIKYALTIAGDRETELHLFHIYYDQIMVPDSSFPAGIDTDAFFNTELIENLREQAEKNLQEVAKNAEQLIPSALKSKITISHSLTGGNPQWEIKEAIDELNPDWVVMGTRGAGKKGFLEGSMAEKIMTKAKLPVIAVPETYQNIQVKNILYATNFSETDETTLQRIFDLFDEIKVQIFVTHFSLDDDNEKEQQRMDALKGRFEKEHFEGKIRFSLVNTGQKEDALQTDVSFYNIDLIAFVSHKKNLFKELFSKELHKKDFFKLGLPMLALHDQRE